MSDKCGSCACANKSQCMKKGFTIDVLETQKSNTEAIVMDVFAAENDGNCKSGTSCASEKKKNKSISVALNKLKGKVQFPKSRYKLL